MNHTTEILSATAIVLLLLGMALFFAVRQWRVLRRLPERVDLSREERVFQRTLSYRRLTASGFMIVLAGLLVGSYWMGQEGAAERLIALGKATPKTELDPAHRQFLTRYAVYWIVFAAFLLGLVILALWDFWAIHRFGQQQLRKIRADRRAMIESEIAQFRRERNGF